VPRRLSVFGTKKSADEIVREAVALSSLSQKDVARRYLDVRERIFDSPENRNRPASSDPVCPDDVPPELFAAVVEYYSEDEVQGLQLILKTVSLCNKYRLPEDVYAAAIRSAYKLSCRLPRFREAAERCGG
jgi:hypothetical protein